MTLVRLLMTQPAASDVPFSRRKGKIAGIPRVLGHVAEPDLWGGRGVRSKGGYPRLT